MIIGSQQQFIDSVFGIRDLADPSKFGQFDASAISADTARVLAFPNASGTIALEGWVDDSFLSLDGEGSDVINGTFNLTTTGLGTFGSLVITGGGSTDFNGVNLTGVGNVLPNVAQSQSLGSLSKTFRRLYVAEEMVLDDGGYLGAGSIKIIFNSSDNFFEFAGGRVGIGTDTPITVLDVNGAITATGLIVGTGEVIAGSINRAADTLTLKIAGTPELSISANLVAIADGFTVDTDTLVVDAVAKTVGIKTVATTFPGLNIGSADGSDLIGIFHDNTNAYIKWNDGRLLLETQEGTNAVTSVRINGHGTGAAFYQLFDGGSNSVLTVVSDNTSQMYTEDGGILRFQHTSNGSIMMWDSAASGETQELQISGFRTDDSRRTLKIGVGVDADDTASFDGLSNYLFKGNIQSTGGAQLGDGGTTNYMGITATGGVVFVGGAGLAFAEINVVSNAVETAIASAGAAVQITIFNTNGPSNNVTPDHTNDHITITKAGIYLITVSSTVNSVTGAASRLEMTVLKNNGTALVGALHCDRDVGGGGSESGSVSISGLADLSVDDTIEVWIENETNTQNYIVEDITLTLVQIGGT